MSSISLDDYLVPGTSATYYISEFITEDEEEYLIRKVNQQSSSYFFAQWSHPKRHRFECIDPGSTAALVEEAPKPQITDMGKAEPAAVGGDLTAKKSLIPQEMPSFVNKYPNIIGRIRDLGVFKNSAHGQPNHIIMNEYAPGQGIMPHEDGPAYHPVVATLSLGSHTIFHYYSYKEEDDPSHPWLPHTTLLTTGLGPIPGTVSGNGRPIDPKPVLSLLLEPRSLVITISSLYQSHLHGIEDVMEDKFEEDGRSPQERIANFDLLKGKAEREAILSGSILERGLRYSLTCRDVEKVTAVGGALFKRLRG